jgi:sulfite dehydrogenase (cytochrome) subunit B
LKTPTKRAVLSIGLAAFFVGCGTALDNTGEAEHDSPASVESMRQPLLDDSVHSIISPRDEPLLPPGPGDEEFVTACVVCHSPRYITMQPMFSRTEWRAEVNKMKNVYGAHISDEQAAKITDYLVSLNGKPDKPGATKGAAYGE